jgi:hypothetical protein
MRLFRKSYNGGANIKLGTYEFEVVSQFTCLATLLANNNDLKPEIEKRILPANRAYYALSPISKIHAVHRADKIKIYKSLIRTVITYGAEALTLNTKTTKILAVFERKVLRRILGAVKTNDTWRRRNYFELMNLYGDVDIVSFIRLSRLR